MLEGIFKKTYMHLCRRQCQHRALKNQVVYLASFPNNNNGWIEKLLARLQVDHCYYAYTNPIKEESLLFLETHPLIQGLTIHYGRSFFTETLPIIAESKWIIADNYFPFLAALPANEQRKVVQVWHADGAVKCFGLEDPKNQERSAADNQRFREVYHAFTDYIVASENMGQIFQHSYGASPDQIHFMGFPRSDYLVNKLSSVGKALFLAKNPQYQGKKIILYAPTYREKQDATYPFDRSWFESDDIAVIERYHPHSTLPSTKVEGSYGELLAATDILITDYSSIPFDYSLVAPEGTMIFYQYDQTEYQARYGLQSLFMNQVPGAVVKNAEELMEQVALALQQPSCSMASFNEAWNTYNDGQATERLADWLNRQ